MTERWKPTIELGKTPKSPEPRPEKPDDLTDLAAEDLELLDEPTEQTGASGNGLVELQAEDLEPLPDLPEPPKKKRVQVIDRRLEREKEKAAAEQTPERASIAVESRTGLAQPATEALNVEIKGGTAEEALDKVFAFEKTKIEKLLATGEFAAEDLASDIREDLADAEIQLLAVGPEDVTERATLEKDIAVAKYKLSLLEGTQTE